MPSLLTITLVALGGALGSVSRYLLGTWVQSATRSIDFPFGTLSVNLFGCFLIGSLSQLAEARGVFSSDERTLVFIGVLGGFTTFSSFGNDTLNLLRDGEVLNAMLNIGANVILGLVLVWLGRMFTFWIWR